MGRRKKQTIDFFFDQSEKSINKHKSSKEGSFNNERFCLDERCPTPSVKQQMWLSTPSTPGGKDYQKCHFRERTESRECSWPPGSQSLEINSRQATLHYSKLLHQQNDTDKFYTSFTFIKHLNTKTTHGIYTQEWQQIYMHMRK